MTTQSANGRRHNRQIPSAQLYYRVCITYARKERVIVNAAEYPPVFEPCQPRNNVSDRTRHEDRFAARLATVAHEPNGAATVDRDAASFFDTIYPTEEVPTMLSTLAGRVLAVAGGTSDVLDPDVFAAGSDETNQSELSDH